MIEGRVGAAPRVTARIAGLFWLLVFVTGIASMLLHGKMVVSGDAAATAANILARESLFRLALASDLVATICYIAATVFVYVVLAPVNRSVSALAAAFSLVGCAAASVSFTLHLAPLLLLKGAPYLSVFTVEQLQAQALTFLRMQGQASSFGFTFFGLHCLLVGWLVYRSTFLPRAIGALMGGAGLGWLTGSFANLLSPPLGKALGPYIIIPGLLGEGALTMWLLVVGVNVPRWTALARAADTSRTP
jgi:hypothetical protein